MWRVIGPWYHLQCAHTETELCNADALRSIHYCTSWYSLYTVHRFVQLWKTHDTCSTCNTYVRMVTAVLATLRRHHCPRSLIEAMRQRSVQTLPPLASITTHGMGGARTLGVFPTAREHRCRTLPSVSRAMKYTYSISGRRSVTSWKTPLSRCTAGVSRFLSAAAMFQYPFHYARDK